MFDRATWLTGPDAEDAAIQAGFCTEETRSECLPNNFFIENVDRNVTELALSEDVTVTLMTWQMEETGAVIDRTVPLETFQALIQDESLHWNTLPYTVTVTEGLVSRIHEVYIP